MMRGRRHGGFTLIELMVVVALIAIVLTLVAPSFVDFIRVQRLKSTNAQLVTDMQLARTEAVARGLPVRVRFTTTGATTCYSLFTTPVPPAANVNTYATQCDCANTPVCPAGVANVAEIKTNVIPGSQGLAVTPNTGAANLAFDPATGGVSLQSTDAATIVLPTFQIDMAIDSARTLRTQISLAGRPSVCVPSGSTLPGVPC